MNWIDLSVRALAMFAAAGLLISLLNLRGKRLSAAFEHGIWTCVLLGMLCLWIPHLHIRAGQAVEPPRPQFPAPVHTLTVHPDDKPAVIILHPPRFSTVEMVWAAGAALMLLRILLGLVILRRLRESSRSVLGEPAIRPIIRGFEPLLGGIDESDGITAPVTVTWPYAQVMLPAAWRTWTPGKLDAVLAHELAHVRRRDVPITFLAAINKSLFWFHPVAWWLDRRLTELAEFAADETAARAVAERADYAEVLLDVAARKRGGLLAWSGAGTGFSGGVRLERRIERILEIRPCFSSPPLLAVSAIVIAALGLLQIEHPLRAQEQSGIHLAPSMQLTDSEAAGLEQKLAANPEDAQIRLSLILHYLRTNQTSKRLDLVFWQIEHHPDIADSPLANIVIPQRDGLDAYTHALALWKAQVAAHPTDINVLANAASAFSASDASEAIDLIKRGQALDHARFTEMLAKFYVQRGWLTSGNPESKRLARADLASSTDPLLLGRTGALLVEYGAARALRPQPGDDLPSIQSLAIDLLSRAQALDPSNQDWPNALSGARQLLDAPISRMNAAAQAPQAIRVGAAVQKANLLSAPTQPKGDVSGTVRLQVTIGQDGHVTNALLVSGPPALAQPALETVRQYVYKPTLLNGNPVEVLTTVDIVF